jgi:molecular chaperone DnaK (HSP70)
MEVGIEHSRKERQVNRSLMENSSRYLIGIDLGTTNSVVAYIDSYQNAQSGRPEINVFEVPQLVGPGEVRALPTLPSFLYFPTDDELESGTIGLPWDGRPQSVVGVMARDLGSLLPARQVMSAKSWLSYGGINRRDKILPREAQPPLISPVESSARYLVHLRNAWNLAMANDGRDEAALFEKQQIALTVPASFDEEARELTVEAARQAGLENCILLEEPLAAFYDWIAGHQEILKAELNDGDLVLICDIGGGTSDFSLVRAHLAGDEVRFERKAIGEHLLLGGDNLDLALVRRVEAKLKGAKLSMRQRHGLQRACCAAKERLLSDPELEHVPITILGGGRQVVGQMLSAELHGDDVLEILTNGFLPLTTVNDLPKHGRSVGLREIGLPYASDPAITKHLAAFLRQAAAGMTTDAGDFRSQVARPDAILFNGGFCAAQIVRERIVDAVAGWFSDSAEAWRPRVLRNVAMHSAVAKGAAHYGHVRQGLGVRVRAGSARTYYIGLRSEQGLQGVCVLPSGVEEGTSLPLSDREFAALANRPVSFTLYSSRTRHDAHGEVVPLQGGQIHSHAPLATVLRYGKKMRDLELAVRLRATFTELGTLELWCESISSPHRWRLQFALRGDEGQAQHSFEAERQRSSPSLPLSSDGARDAAVRLIQIVFGKTDGAVEAEAGTPETLTSRLESILGAKRDAWPIDTIRRFADLLIEVAEGRKKSPQHEVRWLNLLGFCLRPGFGAAGDETRVNMVRKFSVSGPVFQRELQSEVEWLVLLRRVSAGLNASQQHELYRKYLAPLKVAGQKRTVRLNKQVEYDSWRLLSSLENLPANLRASLGSEVLTKIRKDQSDSRWLWPLARLGARIPLYGPLTCVVSGDAVEDWLAAVMEQVEISSETAFAIVQLGRRTGDISRDINDNLRERTIRKLKAAGIAEELIRALEKYVPPERVDAVRMFGESLPKDLQLVSSAKCLLSVTALTSQTGKIA